jgi:hypothetical protein
MGMGSVGRILRGLVVVLIVAASIQSYGNRFFYYFTILSNLLALLGAKPFGPIGCERTHSSAAP